MPCTGVFVTTEFIHPELPTETETSIIRNAIDQQNRRLLIAQKLDELEKKANDIANNVNQIRRAMKCD
jgi:hypothetical protein